MILTFHKVQPQFSFGANNFPPSRIEKLLGFLQRRGFRFVPLEHAVLRGEPSDLAITFDDGYAHLADVLPNLMQRYGVKPTVFIPTAFIGCDNTWDYSSSFQRTPHLSAAAIKELAKLGVRFGAHGHRHLDLTRCNQMELVEELKRPMKELENILGETVSSISYPFGRVNETVTSQARSAGYRFGFTMSYPDPLELPLAAGRLPIYGYDTTFSIRQKVEHGTFYAVERINSGITNRLSGGTSWWRRLCGN
ncbi:MAG: polysaccharide deacetylase family protein [candidate division Zixibacteria bacterium]|nr:polysaccharide deacetylase family protein [candidate division Zixibacteria bacterium]